MVKQNKQRIFWKGVKIVPVVDFLNSKDQLTAFAKDAHKENGVLKLVLQKNPSASIASQERMVQTTKVQMRNHPASNATKEDFQ